MKSLVIGLLLMSANIVNVHAADEAKKDIVRLRREQVSGATQPPRAPIRIPDAYIDGHTLTFDASCVGCTLTLTQDDIIIYSATVEENENGEGEVILPDYLTGEFEVQIEFGSITLVGIIEL